MGARIGIGSDGPGAAEIRIDAVPGRWTGVNNGLVELGVSGSLGGGGPIRMLPELAELIGNTLVAYAELARKLRG